MSILRPYRPFAGRRYLGNFWTYADAMKALVAMPGAAAIVHERTAKRWARRNGEWLADGRDLRIAARSSAAGSSVAAPRTWDDAA
jgi:hypothetical protein